MLVINYYLCFQTANLYNCNKTRNQYCRKMNDREERETVYLSIKEQGVTPYWNYALT